MTNTQLRNRAALNEVYYVATLLCAREVDSMTAPQVTASLVSTPPERGPPSQYVGRCDPHSVASLVHGLLDSPSSVGNRETRGLLSSGMKPLGILGSSRPPLAPVAPLNFTPMFSGMTLLPRHGGSTPFYS